MNKPPMREANSEMISQHGHDAGSNTLHVVIGPDKHYTHHGFSQDDYSKFLNSESLGKHYNSLIKGKFKHTGPHK